MSKKIAKLLNEPEHQVAKQLFRLEEMNGYPSHDARFIAEVVQSTRAKITDLGLDPDDTTAEELYHALLVKFEHDSNLFDVSYAAKTMDFDRRSVKAAEILEKNLRLPERWALKNPAAKNLLRQHPPKHVMKHLGYRSLDSMLKRENISEVLLGSRYLESARWFKQFGRLVSRLDQSTFELRPVRLLALKYERWADVPGPDAFIAHDENTAALAVWPSDKINKAPLLTIVLLLAEANRTSHDESTAGVLASINDMVAWWAGIDYLVAELAAEPVSLNLRDNAMNSLRGESFARRQLAHVRESYWQELVSRYENRPAAEELFDHSVREKIAKLKMPGPEPAYEFAEDF